MPTQRRLELVFHYQPPSDSSSPKSAEPDAETADMDSNVIRPDTNTSSNSGHFDVSSHNLKQRPTGKITMNSILMFAGFLVLASTLAIGMWAFGRWLRSKGCGPLLDRLDQQCSAMQLRVSPLALSASFYMFSGAQQLNRVPLLGSKSMQLKPSKF